MSDRLCLDCGTRVFDSTESCKCGSDSPAYSIPWTQDNVDDARELTGVSEFEAYLAKLVKAGRDNWCDDCEAVTEKQLTDFAEYYGKKEYECAPCAKKRAEDGPSDDELANGPGVEGGISYPMGVR